MKIRCLCVEEDEIPVLWEPIPLMATTSPFSPGRCPHTLWLPSEIKFFFKFSPNVQIIWSSACAPYLLHLPVFYIAFIILLPEGREEMPGKLQSDRFPSPSNKFSVSHYNQAAYSYIFIHLRNHTHTSVRFCGKLCNERAHLVTTLSDLKLVHVMAAKTHLSDAALPFKLPEPNINASECHK